MTQPNRMPLAGLKPKDLIGIPWRVAFALQADGWWLRSDIIWSKPNPMPESVTDRPTKSHEYVFLLAKSERYFFNQDAVRETSIYPNGPNSPESIKSPYGQGFTRRAVNSGNRKDLHGPTYERHRSSVPGGQDLRANPTNGRNIRSVWTIATQPYPEAHFATYPKELVKRCVLAGCPEGGVVLDPFAGSGTTLKVARELNCEAVGIEASAEYIALARKRLSQMSQTILTFKGAAE